MGFQDETWWSRVTQPHLHAWSDADATLRLVQQETPKDDLEPKALACYGLLISCPAAPATLPEQVWLRFVDGRPVSGITTQYLDWCCAKLEPIGKKVLLMVWDNASWHTSKQVRNWIKTHNRAVRQTGQGVRILAFYLPSKSPWLNPIEPHWMHGKRHIVEPARLLTAQEVANRVCHYFGCQHEAHLSLTDDQA
ncbi:MAG: transposase [Anaerolineae bacterium]|nr:transposase [Anaerolineae bacterium]